MNRREFLARSGGLLAAGTLLPGGLSSAGSGGPARKPPNIVLFVSDDHGAWALEGPSNRDVRAPALARLASRGARFTNAFTPCPVSSPARASLATGLMPSQHGVHDWIMEFAGDYDNRDWLRDLPTLFDLFSSAGYMTGLTGKYHLGRRHQAPRNVHEYLSPVDTGTVHFGDLKFSDNGRIVASTGCRTDHITQRGEEFIGRAARSGSPFFLHVGYTATHSPYATARRDPQTIEPHRGAALADFPRYHPHPWQRNEGVPVEGPLAKEMIDDARRGYLAGVGEIDRGVGRILAALERHGVDGDTIVVYTSDHGCAMGHNGIWGKGNSTRPLNMYEVSLRVPLIVFDPRAGGSPRQIERAVNHCDTFLSLLALAGISAPNGRAFPGRSWLPLLAGPEPAWDDTVHGEYGDLRMVRTPGWKWVQRYPDGPHDLYDLVNDPGETLNLAGWEKHREVQQHLAEHLGRWFSQHEDPAFSGLRVKDLPQHNRSSEAWRDGIRERRGLQG